MKNNLTLLVMANLSAQGGCGALPACEASSPVNHLGSGEKEMILRIIRGGHRTSEPAAAIETELTRENISEPASGAVKGVKIISLDELAGR